jgi:hypothetical protein
VFVSGNAVQVCLIFALKSTLALSIMKHIITTLSITIKNAKHTITIKIYIQHNIIRNVAFAECRNKPHYAVCHSAGCHYAECHSPHG